MCLFDNLKFPQPKLVPELPETHQIWHIISLNRSLNKVEGENKKKNKSDKHQTPLKLLERHMIINHLIFS